MANVMIVCPITGKAVATGFAMTQDAFASPTFRITRETTDCFACGRAHEWSTNDAFICDPETSRSPVDSIGLPRGDISNAS
jgi:hypothetical protein